ncbi:hypothetical protein BP6252_02123 [Coleophoma cylindrospora]|uniref:PAC domain-containing protein n=1 Tax=Coleophoma cylindrospora TaxID=1849047 RepID=A0A3D8SDZ3_9HELO|nr:hypothetical protein BP6252_02123 [Coleophoma cylindrospora]
MNFLKSSDRRAPSAMKVSSLYHTTAPISEEDEDLDLDLYAAEPPSIPYYRPSTATAKKRPDSAASGRFSINADSPVRVDNPSLQGFPAINTDVETPKIVSFLPIQKPDPEAVPVLRRTKNKRPKDDRDPFREAKEELAMDSAVQSPTTTYHSDGTQSRAGSVYSYETNATSLPALQSKAGIDDQLEPLVEEDLDPGSFDLVAPPDAATKQYSLETRSEQLFSTEHLKAIFLDPSLLLRFTAFLSSTRVSSIPILIYYLDAIKAMKAIQYSNAIAEALDPIDGFEFTKPPVTSTSNTALEERARQAFDVLVREDLPAYITHTYIQTVSASIQRRITGTLPAHLREASEGLAEVFCLTDPSRPDNPIVFASEEFHRTTQYGMNYVIGRNCRFLQGPKTNPFSSRRIREKIDAGQEHCEVFLNYRRDGSPFMNLLMIAPLCDSRGTIRYFIGAQVDVSGLVKECSDMESLERVAMAAEYKANMKDDEDPMANGVKKDEFQELSEMLNMQELDIVRRWGGRMHKESQEEEVETGTTVNWHKPRLLINEASPDGTKSFSLGRPSGKLSGIYENYLLVRPYPSLRILFASPSLRVPGILQSPFMAKVGGSHRVREELTQALADGRGVTAKVRWISKQDLDGRNRWIHCTPLLGSNGAIGVWMIVIVDDENSQPTGKRFKQAPPVDPKFGRDKMSQYGDNGSIRDDTGSLRSFAIRNGGREDSTRAYAPSIDGATTDGRESPFSLRIGE